MKKAILKGTAAVAILAAWLVLPNIGAHAATVQDTELGLVTDDDRAACNKYGKFAENVALSRDAKTAAMEVHRHVDSLTGLDSEVVAYLHKTVDSVYSVPGIGPSFANVMTSATCIVEVQEWREAHQAPANPAKAARTQRSNKGTV
jgi:hypothetical protein